MKHSFVYLRGALLILAMILLLSVNRLYPGEISVSSIENEYIGSFRLSGSLALFEFSSSTLVEMQQKQLYQDSTVNAQYSDKELKKMQRRKKRLANIVLSRAEAKERNAPIPNPNHADYIVLGKDLHRGTCVLEALIGKFPGITVTQNDGVRIHGGKDFVWFLDGIETEYKNANNIPVGQIDRIEIFINASQSMFGTRGGDAVISIYTEFYQE